jgi:DNA-binding LacI/PurR family transcriptional regulator
MPRSKPTIHDVARRAKVSVGTVSHVLSGQVPVSGERQDRVKRAIAQLGYVPNFHAQGLRRGLSSVVGICFPHVSTAYLNVLAATLEDIALREGFGIMHVFSRHDPATEFSRVRDLLRYQVDGLILFPSSTPEATLDLAHDNATPLVLVDRPIPDKRFDQVILDNRKTIREAAKRLIAVGHRRLLFVCRSRSLLVTQHRIEGLNAAKRQAVFPVDVRILEIGDDAAAVGRQIAQSFGVARPPTAIITSNDHQSSLVLGALRSIAVRCPQNVSLLGIDDPEWAKLVTPRLSVISQPAAAIAQQAWDLLMRRIRHPAAATRTVALEAEIVFRESTGPAPAPTMTRPIGAKTSAGPELRAARAARPRARPR